MQWDAEQARPSPPPRDTDKRGRARRRPLLGRRWALDLVRHAVVAQGRSHVVLPDLPLAQLLWGPRPGGRPANWRQLLGRSLQACAPDVLAVAEARAPDGGTRLQEDPGGGWRRGRPACPAACPLHGRAAPPHRHFHLLVPAESLGVLAAFATGEVAPGCYALDFRNPRWTREGARARRAELDAQVREADDNLPAERQYDPAGYRDGMAKIRRLKAESKRVAPGRPRVAGTRAIYVPVRVFGPSPRSGLTPRQCNLVAALTGEITRATRGNGRPDRAQLVGAETCPRPPGERSVPAWPGLPGGEHVAFNGNGRGKKARLRGHGFRLATWMEKAAYPDGSPHALLLGDLADLPADLGVTAAGYHAGEKAWKSLEEMRALARTRPGRAWLGRCLLRVYAPADYLARWRRYFADRLGFSSIPGAGPEAAGEAVASPAGGVGVRTPGELAAWMAAEGLTDGELAARMTAAGLPVDRTTITRYRHGRPWRRGFQAKLDALLGRDEAAHNSL
jgi:hypothetical protein